ncbi:kinase-like domain-containing protein [Russula emetica]|nr:kinase-like domain-containing protein [Russula emetica]
MDPFIVPKSKSCTPCINPFVKDSTKGISTLGQMTSYVTSHLGSQFWTHAFFVLIVHDYTRIIRWDRGGAVVTAPIHFNEERHLFDFFIRYNYAKSDIRGSDSSVRAPETEELRAATCLIDEFRESGSDRGKAKNFLVVSIPRCGYVNESDHYVIEAPFATISPPTGRATRTFIAYDIRRAMRVFLKDSWRINVIEVPKEGDTYQILRAHDVPHIAICSNSGDIGDDTYHSTQTHLFVDADWAPSPKPAAEFTPHRHYRIVLDTIGTPLERFKCSRDMVRAIHASLIAHQAAYHRCSILHRDISPSNILISEGDDGGGLLIDWDLCKYVNSTERKARRAARTGTWQFMAADLIANPKVSQTFIHDLESAFYVMFWLSLKYLPNSYDPLMRGLVLSTVFNQIPSDSPLTRISSSTNLHPLHNRGDDRKVNWMGNSEDLDVFEVTGNGPLSGLLSSLKRMLGYRHHVPGATADLIKKIIDQSGMAQEAIDKLQEEFSEEHNVGYSQVINKLNDALQEQWPHDDSAQLQEIQYIFR